MQYLYDVVNHRIILIEYIIFKRHRKIQLVKEVRAHMEQKSEYI